MLCCVLLSYCHFQFEENISINILETIRSLKKVPFDLRLVTWPLALSTIILIGIFPKPNGGTPTRNGTPLWLPARLKWLTDARACERTL